MDPVVGKVLEWGATGVLAFALVALYRLKESREREHRAELAQVHKEHAAELERLRETFELKAERQQERALSVLERVGSVVDAARRRRRALPGEETTG